MDVPRETGANHGVSSWCSGSSQAPKLNSKSSRSHSDQMNRIPSSSCFHQIINVVIHVLPPAPLSIVLSIEVWCHDSSLSPNCLHRICFLPLGHMPVLQDSEPECIASRGGWSIPESGMLASHLCEPTLQLCLWITYRDALTHTLCAEA